MNVNGFLLKILNRKYKIIKINWQLNFSKIRFKILLNLLIIYNKIINLIKKIIK